MSNKKRTWSAHRSSSTGDPGDRGYAGDSRYHFPSQGDGRGYFPRDVYVSSEYDRGQRSYRNYDRPPYFNQPDVPAQRGFQSWDRVSDFDYPWPGDSSHAFGDGYYDRFPSSRRMPISARYPYDTSREKMGSTIYDKRYDANVDYRRQPLPPSDYGFAESFHHSSVRPVSNYPSSSSSSWRNVWNQTSNGHNPRSNLWYAKPFSKTFPMRHLRKLQQIKHRDKVEKNATESSNGEEGGSFRELSGTTSY